MTPERAPRVPGQGISWLRSACRLAGFAVSLPELPLAAVRVSGCARALLRVAIVEASPARAQETRPRAQVQSTSDVGIAYLSSPNTFPAECAGARVAVRDALGHTTPGGLG